MSLKGNGWLLLAVMVASVGVTAKCRALTITLVQASVGSTLPGTPYNVVPPNPPGGDPCLFPSDGDYARVIGDAAAYWGSIYATSFNLTITWGFVDHQIPYANAESWSTATQPSGSGAGRVTRGTIAINRCQPSKWYVDDDTSTWSEYPSSGATTSAAIPYRDLSSEVEVGRFITTPATSGDPAHVDLYTVVLHEMGHLLGMVTDSPRFQAEASDGWINVRAPTVIPDHDWETNVGDPHLEGAVNSHSLMAPSTGPGQRFWPSQADISAIAQVSTWWVASWGTGGGGVTGLSANNPVNQ